MSLSDGDPGDEQTMQTEMIAGGSRLAEAVTSFIQRTMRGQDSGLYKVFAPRGMAQMLTTPTATNMLLGSVVSYLNGCYKSLILQDDVYVMSSFAEMRAASFKGKHHEVCLLNIIMSLIQTFHQLIDRSLLDISSYDAYMASFSAEFNRVFNTLAPMVEGLFQHECTGNTDLTKEDPNEPLFSIHQKEVDG